jgi:hypothetical protein
MDVVALWGLCAYGSRENLGTAWQSPGWAFRRSGLDLAGRNGRALTGDCLPAGAGA